MLQGTNKPMRYGFVFAIEVFCMKASPIFQLTIFFSLRLSFKVSREYTSLTGQNDEVNSLRPG